jgi:hypothetical protein
VKRTVARLNPLPWLKRGSIVGLQWLKGVLGGLSSPVETGIAGVMAAAAALSGYLATLLNGSAGNTVLNVLAAAFAAIALILAIHIVAKAVHGGRRSSLELLSFEPGTDGVLKGPEFGWGPAAWMRLGVCNRSGEDTASDVRLVIRRVVAHGADGRSADGSAPLSRNNLAGLHFKVADHDASAIPHLAPNEVRYFDLAKLKAASAPGPPYWGLVVHPPHRDVREELFIGTEYDVELYVAASNGPSARYTARLVCTGWPCSPAWPCDETDVWEGFAVRLQRAQ